MRNNGRFVRDGTGGLTREEMLAHDAAEADAVLANFDAASVMTESCCAVCLERLDTGGVSKAPCLHILHTECWRGWLIKDIARACPICRSPVLGEGNVDDLPNAEIERTVDGDVPSVVDGLGSLHEDSLHGGSVRADSILGSLRAVSVRGESLVGSTPAESLHGDSILEQSVVFAEQGLVENALGIGRGRGAETVGNPDIGQPTLRPGFEHGANRSGASNGAVRIQLQHPPATVHADADLSRSANSTGNNDAIGDVEDSGGVAGSVSINRRGTDNANGNDRSDADANVNADADGNVNINAGADAQTNVDENANGDINASASTSANVNGNVSITFSTNTTDVDNGDTIANIDDEGTMEENNSR